MERICEVVKDSDVNVVLGFAERDGGSLYIAQVTITSDGKIANHRRKIKVRIDRYPVSCGDLTVF